MKNRAKKKTVLITGGSGLLGMGLLKMAPGEYNIIPTYNSDFALNYHDFKLYKFNITKKNEVTEVFNHFKPNYVIHAASIGNVDYCERNKDEAYLVNVEGTKNILNLCKNYGAKLLFTSSNAVFDGEHSPYLEESETNPVNYYGKTKLIIEELIKNSNLDYVIARLMLMYGWNHPNERRNPVTWLIEKLQIGEGVKMVNDTYTNPLFNIQAAKAIWQMIERDSYGLYNIAGKDRVNRYEFAVKTAEVFGLDTNLIEPVSSDYFPGIAKRMPDTTYDVTKMERDIDITPMSLDEGLSFMKKNIEKFTV
ncbi:MAG: NAD(P)-dependent oxidoreductase [Nanoarchaeota archaeon]